MRSDETARSCADWPTSLLSISAMLDPSQSSDGSPDALRKGRIASDVAGGALAAVSAVFENSRARKTKAAIARIIAAEATPIASQFLDLGVSSGGVVAIVTVLDVPPCHASRSWRNSCALWYRTFTSICRHFSVTSLRNLGTEGSTSIARLGTSRVRLNIDDCAVSALYGKSPVSS